MRLTSQFRNREVEMDRTGSSAKLRKVRPDRSYQKRTSAMRNLDGCGSLALEDGSQGVLIRPTKATKVAENQG